ncbi:CAP domain-containing protein [Paenisporosarcina cavernae]|uniref:CAP domain-containing protein n=1 Tax=Paenisporosarcina cavernae TaxID=2320858 RepID=A0A385YRL6_9BACL|nr:CAP domain-containing protein [Paenisporosarcina cavernae]AYC29134.1 hypothetical protein D3873_04285 [Paenisporosarcina cavernae]
MKNLFRILVVLGIIGVIFILTNSNVKENNVLQAPTSGNVAIPESNLITPVDEENVPRPKEGLSTYIGKDVSSFEKMFGKPDRVDPSAYGYSWWVYNQSMEYMMIGVKDKKIVQVYIAGDGLNASPFQVGQTIEDLYRTTIIESEISVSIGNNTYTFTLLEDDLKNRILVKMTDVLAQVYVDEEDEVVEAIRFMDAETLVLHQPYEMMYAGDYLAPAVPSTAKQISIDRANEKQLFALTNIYRVKHGLDELTYDYFISKTARQHSEEMVIQHYFSSESPGYGDLQSRLSTEKIDYKKAAENIAENYYDAAEVVHGWLNSDDHRDTLLDEDMTNAGVGVFGRMYTETYVSRELGEDSSSNTPAKE